MQNSKKKIGDWIRLFIDIALQLNNSGFRLSVSTGKGLLIVPPDVFKVLKNREMMVHSAGKYFIEYEGEHGLTLIHVEINDEPEFTFKLALKENAPN